MNSCYQVQNLLPQSRLEDVKELKQIFKDQKEQAPLPAPVETPSVTDEEVKKVRDNMLRSSKSGLVMSEEDVREMLEKRAKTPQNPPGAGRTSPLKQINENRKP